MTHDPLDHLRDLLAPLGPLRARRMFGGWGLYCGERFFGLVVADRLYLKADAETEPAFRDAGCTPFVYQGRDRPVTLHYFSVPDEAFDDPDAMQPWARRALDAAERAADASRPGRRPSRPPKS